ATKAPAALLGSLTSLAGPGADQLALELGQASKHRQHQPTVGARSIGSHVFERLEASTAIPERAARRPRRPNIAIAAKTETPHPKLEGTMHSAAEASGQALSACC